MNISIQSIIGLHLKNLGAYLPSHTLQPPLHVLL